MNKNKPMLSLVPSRDHVAYVPTARTVHAVDSLLPASRLQAWKALLSDEPKKRIVARFFEMKEESK